MITVYVKTGCQFCARVIRVLDLYEIKYVLKNVADEGVADELISLGGKKQEPFLVDGHTMLYESRTIIDYIEHTYASNLGEKPKPKIHFAKGTEVCKLK